MKVGDRVKFSPVGWVEFRKCSLKNKDKVLILSSDEGEVISVTKSTVRVDFGKQVLKSNLDSCVDITHGRLNSLFTVLSSTYWKDDANDS